MNKFISLLSIKSQEIMKAIVILIGADSLGGFNNYRFLISGSDCKVKRKNDELLTYHL